MTILKAATAYSRKFSVVLSSDHATPATGKTVTVNISKGPSGAFGAAAGAVTEIANGWYQVALTSADTGVTGDLAYNCTATGCDANNFKDEVQAQVFTDLVLNASGRVMIANSLQQNTASNGFVFPMTNTSGTLTTGLTVTAQRTLGAGGFASCANSVVEVGGGWYAINFAASDLNAANIGVQFSATGAQTLTIPLSPTP